MKIFLLALVVLVFYGNTLGNGFVFDDPWQIQNNENIKNLSLLPKTLTSCVTLTGFGDCQNKGIYFRPLQFLSYTLTYQISSNPGFFHFVNLAYLFILSLVLLQFFKIWFKGWWSFIAVVVFLAYPGNSEVVNWVSAVPELLLAIFGVAFLTSHLKGKHILAAIFLILALLAKETAIIFIPLAFFGGKRRGDFLLYGGIVLAYFMVRSFLLGGLVHNFPGYHDMNLSTQLVSSLVLYPRYLLKLLFPWPLNAQHDYYPANFSDWEVIPAILVWLISFGLAVWAYKKQLRISLIGFLLIFFAVLPLLLFINKIGRFVFSERYLFVPSIGLVMIVLENGKRLRKNIALGLLVTYLCLSWLIVWPRNKDFKDDFALDKSIAKYAKENYGVHYNLGVRYAERGEHLEAASSYNRALAINPNLWQAYFNLGNTYLNLGQENLAAEAYQKVLLINPDFEPVREKLERLEN